MRENGYLEASWAAVEERLERRIQEVHLIEEVSGSVGQDIPDTSGPKHTPILMEDLTGPYILYAAFLAAATGMMALEVLLKGCFVRKTRRITVR